jgi:molybdate transport system permease protein
VRTPGPSTPISVWALAIVACLFLALPVVGLVINAPWSELISYLNDDEIREALRLSLAASLSATLVALLLGFPLAWVLARSTIPGRSVIRALTTLPLVLPPVVGGVALLSVLGRLGFVGSFLDDAFDFTFFGTPAAVIVAETFVALPFLTLTIEAGLRSMDGRYELAAATLGASRWVIMRRIVLPMAAPSIVAGMVLAWARALGEFGATITFAGNISGRTQTIPLAVYVELNRDLDGAIVLSLILIAVSLGVLIAMRDRWLAGLQ